MRTTVSNRTVHDHDRIGTALAGAMDTRAVQLGVGVIARFAEVFEQCFGQQPAMVVADVNTFAAAGQRVMDLLRAARIESTEPVVFGDPDLHAEYPHVETLQRVIDASPAIPIAVGSGTVNDMVKLAAHLCGRPYMVVATAASMDGYSAYGASITKDGCKQTFFCPAPRAVVADLEVIRTAPAELNAAGYGDLLAKTTAGADWLVADALGIEPLDPPGWRLVQEHLRDWLADSEGIRRADMMALRNLIEGLLMSGFAMQRCRSSRPASGAEHQFSHLWDMQQHHHQGRIPLHGCKVAVGTLAVAKLYEQLCECRLSDLDIEAICGNWPGPDEKIEQVRAMYPVGELQTVAISEMQAKYSDRAALHERLKRLRQSWPTLRSKLREQLISSEQMRQMLQQAGAPFHPAQIGISLQRLRESYRQALHIRRRYTVLDMANECGLMEHCLEGMFAPGIVW